MNKDKILKYLQIDINFYSTALKETKDFKIRSDASAKHSKLCEYKEMIEGGFFDDN